MAWDSDLDDLLTAAVRVSTGPTSRANLAGSPSFATTASTYPARVVWGARQVRDDDGSVVEAQVTAWVASTGPLTREHRIGIPQADGSTGWAYPPVLLVEQYPDEDGRHHAKVTFGWGGAGR